MSNWVAFLDLLGTKESSSSERGLRRQIEDFQQQVVDREGLLGPETSLYHFSDCIFLEVPGSKGEVLAFLTWLNEVQANLYAQGYFFKCAVTSGSLEPTRSTLAPSARRSSIAFFNDSAVRAYELHEAFKGIGIYFDNEAVELFRKLDIRIADIPGALKHCISGESFWPFAQSFYVPTSSEDVGRYNVIPYSDFRIRQSLLKYVDIDFERQKPLYASRKQPTQEDLFNAGELAGLQRTPTTKGQETEVFRQIVRHFITANLKSERYGRYYMSLLCSVVSASDYSSVTISDGRDGISIEGTPPICDRLLWRRKTLDAMEQIPGFPQLVFRLVDCILGALPDPEERILASRCLAGTLSPYRSILRHVRSTPRKIIEAKNKEHLLSAFGEAILEAN